MDGAHAQPKQKVEGRHQVGRLRRGRLLAGDGKLVVERAVKAFSVEQAGAAARLEIEQVAQEIVGQGAERAASPSSGADAE